MSAKSKVAIVSDIHMADPDFPASQKSMFISFLDEFVKENVKELILLGDILELSQGRMMDVYESCLDVLMKLLEVAGAGTKITYILGNHDFTISDVRGFDILPHPRIKFRLPREEWLPVRSFVDREGKKTKKVQAEKVLTSGCYRRIQGKSVFLAHGHEFNHYFRGNPSRFDTVIKAARFLEMIDPKLDDRMLEVMEGLKTGLFKALYNTETPGKRGIERDELEFVLAARDVSKYEALSKDRVEERTEANRIDYVFFGHTHVQEGPVLLRDNVLEDSGKIWGVYFNTGTWTIKDGRTDFTVIDEDGKVQNHSWKGERGAFRGSGV